MAKSKTRYFKTREQVEAEVSKYYGRVFTNPYQMKGDRVTALVREFDAGFAVQLGDCGAYVER